MEPSGNVDLTAIAQVNTRMGIRTIKNPTGDKTFTEDILKIERCGPNEDQIGGGSEGSVRSWGSSTRLSHTTCAIMQPMSLIEVVSDISESLRNLALDHANSVPFQKHYLGREVCADTWGILRGQKPQQALIRQACSVGHSISKRRPTDLTVEQAASVNTHPLIKRLERDLRGLRQGSEKYKAARRKVRNEKQNLKSALKQQIRDEWTAEQAVDDIERQLQALTAPLSDTLEGQFRRRDNTINAVIFVKTKQERPRRCFICVGKALTLAGDDGAVQDLIHEFYTSGDVTKHLRRKHLSNLRDGDKIQCHVCDMSLDHKMHLKNHAL
ncbi:hypothetical protein EDB80DRAFT_692446 [Ilyonectria destructans]|nr:hypothetical protein EDB80DRAFT_692446 [Ilyonectria destructans]